MAVHWWHVFVERPAREEKTQPKLTEGDTDEARRACSLSLCVRFSTFFVSIFCRNSFFVMLRCCTRASSRVTNCLVGLFPRSSCFPPS